MCLSRHYHWLTNQCLYHQLVSCPTKVAPESICEQANGADEGDTREGTRGVDAVVGGAVCVQQAGGCSEDGGASEGDKAISGDSEEGKSKD